MKTDWKKLLPQCFGDGTRSFAEHPADEETAFDLLSQLRERSIGWPTFAREVRRQLGKMPKLDGEAEFAVVRERFKPWLLD